MKQEEPAQEKQILRLDGMDQFFLPYHLFTFDGVLLYANNAARTYWNETHMSLLNHSVFELFPHINSEAWAESVSKLKKTEIQHVNISPQLQAGMIVLDENEYIQLIILPEDEKKGSTRKNTRLPTDFVHKKHLKDLFSNSEHFVSLLDTKGILLNLNDKALSLGRYKPGDALGQHFYDTLSTSSAVLDKQSLEDAINKAANGLSTSFQTEIKSPDGKRMHIEFVLKPVNNRSGKVEYILSEGKDITHSPSQKKGFLRDAEIYRRIGRSLSRGGILIINKELKYVLAEGSIFEDLGFENAHQMENRFVEEIHDGAQRKLLSGAFRKALAGETLSFEATARNKKRYSISIYPIYNESGEIENALLSAFDISESKRATKKLEQEVAYFKRSESLYRLLARSLPGGLFILFDRDIRYLLIEGQGMEIMGLEKEKVEGRRLQDLDPVSYQEGLHYYRQALEGRTISFEKKYEDKNAWFHWTFQPFYNEDGSIEGGMVIGSNINKLKETEERYNTTIKELREANNQLKIENGVRQLIQKNLQEQTKELEQKNLELEQFAYVASHDLQEPLRMVSSYTQLLQSRYRDKLDAGAEEFISYAIEGATRMQSLINDLLFYSRVGRKEMSFEKINLGIVLQLVMRNLALLLEETNAIIEFKHLPFVNADASQMVQLFQNLISNAIKFRKKDQQSKIVISYKETERFFVVSVKDNGIGISMEYKDRIFQIFQRLHTRDKYPGTGIGLAICKKIVERHGGEIWVESELGAGTTFLFTLQKQ